MDFLLPEIHLPHFRVRLALSSLHLPVAGRHGIRRPEVTETLIHILIYSAFCNYVITFIDPILSLLLLIIGCVVVTLLRIDERLSMSLVQLSLVLEVAALIAQSSLNQNKRAESLTTNFFLTSWFYGKILMNCYCTILSYVNIYRFRVAGDMGFRHFATHGYYNTYNCMLLGYFYNHTSMRKIQNEKLKKLKKVSDGRSFL